MGQRVGDTGRSARAGAPGHGKLQRRLLQLLGALTLAGGIAVPPPPLAHATILPSCGIQLSDLRHGYAPSGSGYTMLDLGAIQYYGSPSAYNADSALVSYTSSYSYFGSPLVRSVDDSFSLYTSAHRAQQAYDQNLVSITRWHRTTSWGHGADHRQFEERWDPVAAMRVGDESREWVTATHDPEHTYLIAFLFFRRGRYLASVRIFGPLHTFDFHQTEPLAQRIDSRIRLICTVS